MAGLFEISGAQPKNQSPWHPKFIENFGDGGGLFTNRCVLTDPSNIISRRYYGGKVGALIDGLNTEISVRNTLIRRYGLSAFSTAVYPTIPDYGFSFELTDGTIRVLIDTGSSGNLAVTSVAASVGTTAVYTGVYPAGGANAYAGLYFTVTGFSSISRNNGYFLCTASTTTSLTLANANATAETPVSAAAVTAGGVYWDEQNGSKQLLFAKSAGAGQTHFVAVAGILYAGDGMDTWKYTPLNPNTPPGSLVSVWKWGIAAPTTPPSVTLVASGAAAPTWQLNTIYSTMGLTVDSTGLVWQLISVNADNSQTATAIYGTAGTGSPPWNQTLYATTTESSGTGIVWQNLGEIDQWQPNTLYADGGVNGTPGKCAIYDPVSQSIYVNHAYQGALAKTSNTTKPDFTGILGGFVTDKSQDPMYHSCNWYCIGTYSQLHPWKPGISYAAWYGGGYTVEAANAVIEPFILPPSTTQPIYLEVPTTAGTSGTTYGPFPVGTTAGNLSGVDGQLQWMCLGSATWVANTPYIAWQTQGTAFGCVQANGCMQVCVKGTRSGLSLPTFGAGYGDSSTLDGDITWLNVGPQVTWVAGSATTGIWHLPLTGFQPPQTSQKYGGSVIDSSSALVEAAVMSGKSFTVAPTWGLIGTNTGDPGVLLAITSVTVSGVTTTYGGTITGGGGSAFAGHVFLVSGCGTVGNNGYILVTSSTATTLVCTTTTQVTEASTPASAAAVTGLVWYAESNVSINSLSWKTGYIYAYSFKARAFDDYYSPLPLGGGVTPPGSNFGAFTAPTGSATEAISTASPLLTIVGANAGSVNVLTGMGSTDPQVDTIVIWRTVDGGGPADLFELTEIPAPPPIGGQAQSWTFSDYLPDSATTVNGILTYPGLNIGIPAPIDDSNDPPDPTFLPMEYNFQRIWGSVGSYVAFTGGPDVTTGNPNEAFAPADSLPFLSSVIRVVKITTGSIVFTTNSIEIIVGGPLTSSFFSVTLAPGIGMTGFNALDVYAGEIFFIDTTGELRIVSPSLSVTSAGFAIADQLSTFNPALAYIAFHEGPNDSAIYFGTGSAAYNGNTGWFRMNPRQIPGGMNGPEPVWSTFAAISGGCQMLQSIEISPGVKKLLVGSTSAGTSILERNTTVFTDNGTSYDAKTTIGSLRLCHRGEIALCRFVEADFALVTTNPTVSFLIDEVATSTNAPFVAFTTADALYDPPAQYGMIGVPPQTYTPLRFYFLDATSLAKAVHMQIKIDFGTTSVADECFNLTLYGAVVKNQ